MTTEQVAVIIADNAVSPWWLLLTGVLVPFIIAFWKRK